MTVLRIFSIRFILAGYEKQRKEIENNHRKKRDLRNDALRSKRGTGEYLSAEMARYLAAFVNSERVLRLSEKEGSVRMCTALEEMIQEGKAEGKAEDILDILGGLGFVPYDLERRIMEEKNIDTLRIWLKRAIKVKTVEEFLPLAGYPNMK